MDTSSFFHYDETSGEPPAVVFLEGCGDAEWAVLLGYTSRSRFRKGDVVIEKGQRDRVMLIILEGQLETVIGSGRKKRRLGSANSGSVIGELSFLDGGVRTANVVAETDGELLLLPFTAFEALAEHHPVLAHRLLLDLSRILAQRLRRTTARLEQGSN